ncbi:DUF2786 domain-containing protein [Aliarcobacter lanthieri]|uniref:DUF2786 domain-containing protein n=1 Tax=Aliarcobacter lanthieri TaxID=1355374 RepID=UPI003AB09756
MSEKIKEKIEKLLNLSMSDNEHEAALALDRALKLMNEHNITKDEIYKQNFINEDFEINYIRVPDWLVRIYSNMAEISGCVFTWRNGRSYAANIKNRKAKGSFTGRQRDVENAVYLSEFLKREVEKRLKKYKAEIDEVYTEKYKRILIKSYKIGIINTVSGKLLLRQDEFFSEQTTGMDLVCVDRESRIKDSMAFLEELLGKKPKDHKSQAQYESQGLRDGMNAGDDIELNQAVSKQDEIKMVGA